MGTLTLFTGSFSLRAGVTDGSCFFFVVNAAAGVAVVVFRSDGLALATGEAFGESFLVVAADVVVVVIAIVVFRSGGLIFATGETFGESFVSICSTFKEMQTLQIFRP